MSKIIAFESQIIDFPKIKSPFVREKIDGKYVVTPEIAEGFEWVFDDAGVKAVDKLHGTNICVRVVAGRINSIDNRTTRVMNAPAIEINQNAGHARMLSGVIYAIDKGYFKGKGDGRYYGELIAPEINGNLHGAGRPVFVPFDYLEWRCHWKSWINGKYPKTFESISDWFKELPSLYSQRAFHLDTPAEGVIFLHPDGRRAKLRRDMFDWYEGERH